MGFSVNESVEMGFRVNRRVLRGVSLLTRV